MKVIYFLGRLHVVVLHIPIGVVLVTLLVEWLARRERFKVLDGLTPGSVGYGGGFSNRYGDAGTHACAGGNYRCVRRFSSGIRARIWGGRRLCVRVAPLARECYRAIQLPAGIVLIVLVTLTGHYGGNITHGSSYLLEHAPQPLRAFAGMGRHGDRSLIWRKPMSSWSGAADLQSALSWLSQRRSHEGRAVACDVGWGFEGWPPAR